MYIGTPYLRTPIYRDTVFKDVISGKEMANFVHRFERHLKQIKAVEFMGKFNGATGNFNAHMVAYPTIDWPNLAKKLVPLLFPSKDVFQ